MKIFLKNYGIVKSAEIEFLPGLNIIKGESGSGKSTVLRGIEGAVFNTPGDSFITQGETEAEIAIEYNNHIIKRKRTQKASSYVLDGDELAKVGKTPVKEILSAFGIKEIKADSTSIRPNFLSQFSTPFLVDEKPSKIFEYLTITSSAVNLKDVENEITNDLTSLKQQKKTKEETLTTLKTLILSSSKILDYKKDILNLNKDVESISKKENIVDCLTSSLTRIEKLTKSLSYQNNVIQKIESVLNKIQKEDVNYTKIHKKLSTINDLEKIIFLINKTINKTKYLKKDLDKLENSLIKIDENYFSKKIELIESLSLLISKYNSKNDGLLVIKNNGLSLKNELDYINNSVLEFKLKNIPTIVISTNDNLATSLKIKMNDIISILTDNEEKEKRS